MPSKSGSEQRQGYKRYHRSSSTKSLNAQHGSAHATTTSENHSEHATAHLDYPGPSPASQYNVQHYHQQQYHQPAQDNSHHSLHYSYYYSPTSGNGNINDIHPQQSSSSYSYHHHDPYIQDEPDSQWTATWSAHPQQPPTPSEEDPNTLAQQQYLLSHHHQQQQQQQQHPESWGAAAPWPAGSALLLDTTMTLDEITMTRTARTAGELDAILAQLNLAGQQRR